MQKREQHIIKGQVQGVGFRPFVFNIAKKNKLTGLVQNTPKGVLIEIQGTNQDILQFNKDFLEKLPPLARITQHERQAIPPVETEKDFAIILSEQGSHEGHNVLVSPDVALCADCKRDMLDKNNRRFAYAFTNCTSCGPRYTITKSIPYDRPVTSMGCFPLCPECHQEYSNPVDRRFHAQPNACALCGPHLWLSDGKNHQENSSISHENPPYLPARQNVLAENDKALLETLKLINQGKIIAIKGLGGFQLACDAFNEYAVARLRERKNRPHKAFALMVKDLETAREIAHIGKEAEELLLSISAPIVLCPVRENILPKSIAPDTGRVGIMLAYTPLHLLLFSPEILQEKLHESEAVAASKALVMTSANQGGKPICIQNRQALHDLEHIADYYLFHDRDILVRVDDSVCLPLEREEYAEKIPARNSLPKTIYFRRARGYVPSPVMFPAGEQYCSSVYATGSFLKNTLTLTKGNEAYQSQHIGDLGNLEALDFFEETSRHLQKLLEVKPQKVLTDLHPDFPSTMLAEQYSHEKAIAFEQVQHHIAHAYSVLGEQHELSEEPYFALILDGTGLGYDKSIWGGEIFYLFARKKLHYRLASLSPIPLIGGDKANFEPWRIALALHKKAQKQGYLTEQDSFPLQQIAKTEIEQCSLLLEKNINCPLSSGCGRLFDAISALLGFCTHTSYEGQAAIRLENSAFFSDSSEYIEIPLHINETRLAGLLHDMANDFPDNSHIPLVEIDSAYLYAKLYRSLQENQNKNTLARIFHNSLVHAFKHCLQELDKNFPAETIIFSGGVFNNELLVRSLYKYIEKTILFSQNTCTGDACISLGQAFYGSLQKSI